MTTKIIDPNTLREISIVDLFREQVALKPFEIAITSDERSVTFAQLHRSAADIAASLNGIGVAADMPVGIFAEPSVELVAGIWGILLAGGAYLPLAPDYPEARLTYMIENSGVGVILCQEKLRPALLALAPAGVRIVTIGDTAGADPSRSLASPSPTDLAYLIYTSGSTGRPKGVMVEHRGIANQMRWLRDRCGIGPGSVVLQKTPVSFDAAQWEILSICCGSRVVIGGAGCYRDPERLIAIIREHGATKLQCVPTLLQALLDTEGFEACTSLATIFSGGEMLSRKLAEQCCAALPGCDLVNFYGPTECTINASAYFVDRATLGEAPSAMPIGRAVDNTELLILDETGVPAPVGEIGELYIGGEQVARGYFNRPDLTAERFVAHPVGEAVGRIYKTGDLAHWNADGTVQFVGRADNQIKLRGFRVELDEIRTVIETHDWVKTAAVLVKESPRTGFQNLVACIELSPREAALMDQGSHGTHHVTKSNKLQVKAQLSGAGCRDAGSLSDATPVDLPGRTAIDAQSNLAFSRKTYRFFEGGGVTRTDLLRLFERPATSATPRDPASLSLAELAEILRYFGPFESAERLLPKYTYASPGALYATQLYLEVRNVAGLADGFHYFHPLQHRLYLIAGPAASTGEDAGAPRLALHFVGKKGAIEPVYKTNIQEVVEFETGHMLGVFDRVLPGYGLAVARARHDGKLQEVLAGAQEDYYLGGFEITAASATGAQAVEAVDFYVDAHPDKIPDLPGGQYLYRDGDFARMSDELVEKKHVIAINQQVYEQASFGVTMVSRGAPAWLRYISLGRALQHLQMNDLNLGLMSSGYSSRNGQDLPSARRIARILGHEPDASYFAVGGRVSDAQIVSRGMKEDSVHMMGPAELIREDIKSLLPDYMMPNKIVLLDHLPLSSSGKVDVIALRSNPALDLDIVERPVVAPRTPTEERIGAIWGELLRHESISIRDDFFETGGNSLIAVALINRINRTFGCTLSLQILFDRPTIEQLAACVDSADAGAVSRFVRLSNGSLDKPVFCWPGLGGYPMSLRTLAGEVGLDRPVYGI
ncbi:MAG TPA: amino acid adenylation domain-containing protein, partial [Saliniramus sp.]|nr:amino acid adenylation domain-containing protein [Saliniramus sp.]